MCQNNVRKNRIQGVQHHACSLVVLLQGLITIIPTKTSIGRTSSSCKFEFAMGLQITKYATHQKVNSCVYCYCEYAYFGHNLTCDESLLHHNGIHPIVTRFLISFFFEFLTLFSFF
jgi:hypothetical protein